MIDCCPSCLALATLNEARPDRGVCDFCGWEVKLMRPLLQERLADAEAEVARLARGHDEYNLVNQLLTAENDRLIAITERRRLEREAQDIVVRAQRYIAAQRLWLQRGGVELFDAKTYAYEELARAVDDAPEVR